MKAFEVAYASELDIIKAMDTTTLGITRKMQRTQLVCEIPMWKLQFLQNKTQLFSHLGT